MWSWWRRASSCMDPSKLLVYIIQCVELTSDSTKQGCHVPPKSGLQRSRLWKMPYSRKKYTLICTALKISLPSCPFNCNSHLMVILHSYSSHSMQQIFYLYSLHTHFVFRSRSWSWIQGLKFSRKQSSSSSAMDVQNLQQQSSEGESDSQGGRSLQESWDSDISADEEDLIIRLHKLLGDRWALIAGRLPWRTTEEIERYWKMRSQEIDQSSE